jgi:prepilin signal peptidase PulO-like enzyme (type II secretory pathway)
LRESGVDVDYEELQWLPLLMFCFGLLFGSFLNVVGYRVPRGESIAFPPSHCPKCNRQLKAIELIPVFSWIFLGGRCRTCKSEISVRYPLIETITAILFALTGMKGYAWPEMLAWCLFWMLLVSAMACDFTSMRIPNVLSYSGGITILIVATLTHIHPFGFLLLGGGVCFFAIFLIHILSGGKMGLGDAKLYFSIGVMLGPWYGLLSLAFASAFGTVIGLFLRSVSLLSKNEPVPFVPYICIGVILAAFYGHSFIVWYMNLLLH